MGLFNKVRRRRIVGTSVASLAASTTVVPEAHAAISPKAPGEIKVVAIFGTTDWNNGVGHELCVRQIFESNKNMRMIVVRANRLFTPDLISDADLLITCRGAGVDPIDLFVEDGGIADKVVQGGTLWTDINVKAIIDNVRNRGMGLLALHNSIVSGNEQFTDFLGVRSIDKHALEPVWYTRINKTHPIMQGVGKFIVSNDEQYSAIIKAGSTDTLFESTSVHEKRQAISGWALERDQGRIVGLLPGSTVHAYQAPEYRNIFWRAAHWAMKRDIPMYPNSENRYYKANL